MVVFAPVQDEGGAGDVDGEGEEDALVVPGHRRMAAYMGAPAPGGIRERERGATVDGEDGGTILLKIF